METEASAPSAPCPRAATRTTAPVAAALALLIGAGCPPAAAPCASHADCPAAQLCHAGSCRTACNQRDDCTGAEQCVDGLCLPAGVLADAAVRVDRGAGDLPVTDGTAADQAAGDRAPGEGGVDSGADASRTDGWLADLGARDLVPADRAAGDGVAVDSGDAAGLERATVDTAGSADSGPGDGAIAERGGLDQAAADGRTGDGAVADSAAADAVLADGARPDAALPDTALPDLFSADSSAGDTASGDAAVVDAGAPGCGDGVIGFPEQCDDGNHLNQDGCSGRCELEPGGALVAFYRFEGDGRDWSGHALDAQAQGSPQLAAGQRGQALFCTDSRDYFWVPDSAALDLTDTLTLSLWIYLPASSAQWGRVVSKGSNGAGNTASYGIWMGENGSGQADPTRFRFIVYDGSLTELPSASALPRQSWQHLAVSYAAGAVAIYINGALDVGASIPITSLPVGSEDLAIGYDRARNVYGFIGGIDELSLWDQALTATEVQRLYQAQQ